MINKVWKKSNGNKVLISEMNNGYLINAYKLIKRKLLYKHQFNLEAVKEFEASELALRSEIVKRALDVPTTYDTTGRINKLKRPQRPKTSLFKPSKSNIPNLL